MAERQRIQVGDAIDIRRLNLAALNTPDLTNPGSLREVQTSSERRIHSPVSDSPGDESGESIPLPVRSHTIAEDVFV